MPKHTVEFDYMSDDAVTIYVVGRPDLQMCLGVVRQCVFTHENGAHYLVRFRPIGMCRTALPLEWHFTGDELAPRDASGSLKTKS